MIDQPIPIHDYRKQIVARLSEAEWTGDDKAASALRIELDRVDQAIARGELWEVPW